jgi:hypothetical protein
MKSIKTGPSSFFLLGGLLALLLMSMPTTFSMSTTSTSSDELSLGTYLEQSNGTKTNTTTDSTSMVFSDNSSDLKLKKKCGFTTCKLDEYCCNFSCGICASIKGGDCRTIICNKPRPRVAPVHRPRLDIRPVIVSTPRAPIGRECDCDSQCPRGMQCEHLSGECKVLSRAFIPC